MKFLNLSITVLTSTVLAACGGGGGGEGTTTAPTTTTTPATAGPSAEGVYGGTLSGDTKSTAFELLVLENGEFWSMYGTKIGNTFGVAGFIQGTGTSNNGSFTSSNSKDLGYAPAVAGSTTAAYDATATTISGTWTLGANHVTLNGGPIAGSLYNYNTAASLTTIAGNWSTTSVTGESINLTVAADGSYTAVGGSGCNFSGTITPRASGKNVYNVGITFGAAPCVFTGQSGTGIALVYPITGGLTQLLVAATDSTHTFGSAIFGTR
jgi:hypothetical protein